jgi:hypothetical protein
MVDFGSECVKSREEGRNSRCTIFTKGMDKNDYAITVFCASLLNITK